MATLREEHIGLTSRRMKAVATVVCLLGAVGFFGASGVRAGVDTHFGAKGIAAWSSVSDDYYEKSDCAAYASGGIMVVVVLSDHWAFVPEIRYVRSDTSVTR